MKKTVIISGVAVAVVIIAVIIIGRIRSKGEVANLYVEAKQGAFDIIVTTTGELQAKNSTDIYGPEFTQSRNIRAMDIKITDLVPEGTEVKQGDYVATLDRTTFDNNLKDEYERLVTQETNLEMKILDTAVTLSNLRDNIKNLRFSVEEAQITLQQSKYEPPTTIRQAEIAKDKAERSLDQAIRGYALKVEQAKSDMRTMRNNLSEQQQRVNDLETVLKKFVITAPSDGMIIYKRDRTGTKRKVGSSISPWDNVVATLPDMSSMISKTYVNEIDVSKVKTNQKVEIVVDAFPEKQYTGVVTSVANIGEQLPSADAKVFEVVIAMNESDPILRPSMTTGNKIITKTIDNVTYIPLESVQTGADSIPFVYLRNGDKQIVVLGESNENHVVVEQGITAGTLIYLNTPEEPENFRLKGEELIAVIKEHERLKKEEEAKAREAAQRAMGGFPGGPGGFGPGGFSGGQGGFTGAPRNIPGNQGAPASAPGGFSGAPANASGAQPSQPGTQAGQPGQVPQGAFQGAPSGQGGGRMMNMTAEQRAQMQKLRESGDTAAMRQFFRNMRQQQGGQPGQQQQRNINGEAGSQQRPAEQPQAQPDNN
ncbi:MAG TPA: HlyD family efflux transporter periplasmic adaptor subunit [Bacteroidales bacterium]|nr:HlyD family efflux transporter periplasmic adaptor subunit [Bacteroidales bacterium]